MKYAIAVNGKTVNFGKKRINAIAMPKQPPPEHQTTGGNVKNQVHIVRQK